MRYFEQGENVMNWNKCFFGWLLILLVFLPDVYGQNTTTLTQVRLGIDSNESQDRRLTKTTTQNKINRELFGQSYACVPVSVVSGSMTWDMMVTTDPFWNRLIFGDYEKWIKSYGSWGTGSGQFKHPHGIDRSADGIIFVADTGNNRVVVLKMYFVHSGDDTSPTSLSYVTSITGLSLPYDVAWDDNGTTNNTDDYLWVADTGNHRIIKYRFYSNNTFSTVATYGGYGTGTGQFRHPRAIAVGRTDGLNDNNIYVVDTGNNRIIRLEDGTSGITWKTLKPGNFTIGTLSSIETDWYGGVWITDKRNHIIFKRDRYLNFLDSYGTYGTGQQYGELNNPTDFSIYFTAQPSGSSYMWTGHDATFASERWGDGSGGTCYQMGTRIAYVTAIPLDCPGGGGGPPPSPIKGKTKLLNLGSNYCSANCKYNMTDYAKVTIRVYNDANQLVRTLISNQEKLYGMHIQYWDGKNSNGQPVPYDNYYFSVSATSLYTGASSVSLSSALFDLQGYTGGFSASRKKDFFMSDQFTLSKNYPNPFNPTTKINFEVPRTALVKIIIYDILGREITTLLDDTKGPGSYEIIWNGRDRTNTPVASGIYFFRLVATDMDSNTPNFVINQKVILVK